MKSPLGQVRHLLQIFARILTVRFEPPAYIAEEYATKRYRSNVINWGMLPLQMAEVPTFEVGDYIYIPGIKAALDNPGTTFKGYVIHEDAPVTEITLYMESLTAEEREIIKAGSLINFNKNRQM